MSYVSLAKPRLGPSGPSYLRPFTAPGSGRGATWRGSQALGYTDTAPGVEDWSDEWVFNPTGIVSPTSQNLWNVFWCISWTVKEPIVNTRSDAISLAGAFARAAGKNEVYLSVLGVIVSPYGAGQAIEVIWDWSQWQYNRMDGELRQRIVNETMKNLGLKDEIWTTRLLLLHGDKWRTWSSTGGIAPLFVSERGNPNFASPTKAAVNPNPDQLLGGSCVECPKMGSPLPGSTKGSPGTPSPNTDTGDKQPFFSNEEILKILGACAAGVILINIFKGAK